jgi:hypothetical protein
MHSASTLILDFYGFVQLQHYICMCRMSMHNWFSIKLMKETGFEMNSTHFLSTQTLNQASGPGSNVIIKNTCAYLSAKMATLTSSTA